MVKAVQTCTDSRNEAMENVQEMANENLKTELRGVRKQLIETRSQLEKATAHTPKMSETATQAESETRCSESQTFTEVEIRGTQTTRNEHSVHTSTQTETSLCTCKCQKETDELHEIIGKRNHTIIELNRDISNMISGESQSPKKGVSEKDKKGSQTAPKKKTRIVKSTSPRKYQNPNHKLCTPYQQKIGLHHYKMSNHRLE